MDKIHAMQLFIRVADLESFSRAAETLALPKGSVSRQIQALESHLGVRLLHRTTRRVQLTQDGMVYYERAKDLLSNLDELDGMFQHDPASISGRLRVDMPVGFAKAGDPASADFFAAVSGHRTGAEQQRPAGGRDPRGV